MMIDHPEQNCGSCVWWERGGPRLANAERDPSCPAGVGTCQLRAPVVIQGNSPFPVSMFPQTHESRFCASWDGVEYGGGDGDGGERVPLGAEVLPFRRVA